MEISQMLLKYEVERLFNEAKKMQEDLEEIKTPETEELSQLVERKIKQLQAFNLSFQFMTHDNEWSDLNDLYHAFRQVKIELRLSRRKFKRMQTTEARFKKIQVKESHVATFVA